MDRIYCSKKESSGTLANVEESKIIFGPRAKYRSPLGKEVQAVNAWVDDLVHLVGVSGGIFYSSPASIHFLTPPVCPPHW